MFTDFTFTLEHFTLDTIFIFILELEQRRGQIENQLASAGLTVEAYLEGADDEDAETADEFWAGIDERSEQADGHRSGEAVRHRVLEVAGGHEVADELGEVGDGAGGEHGGGEAHRWPS